MNKSIMLALGLSASLSFAATAAEVGFVDLAKVVDSSTYLKQQNATLNQSVKPTTTKLEQLGKELDGLRHKAETEGQKMKEADVQQLKQQYQTKLGEYNSIQQDLQTRVRATLQTMNNTLDGRVKQAAEQLRQENHLDFILNKNIAIASDAKSDLTDKMIQKVNAIK